MRCGGLPKLIFLAVAEVTSYLLRSLINKRGRVLLRHLGIHIHSFHDLEIILKLCTLEDTTKIQEKIERAN